MFFEFQTPSAEAWVFLDFVGNGLGGLCGAYLDVISKFGGHENTVSCSIAVFCCIAVCFAFQTP